MMGSLGFAVGSLVGCFIVALVFLARSGRRKEPSPLETYYTVLGIAFALGSLWFLSQILHHTI